MPGSEGAYREPIALALTGASGVQYGLRLLECLLAADECVWLMLSKAAQVVIGLETDWQLPGRPADVHAALVERFACSPRQLRVFGREEWTAPPASGSARCRAMVVCPCTTGTLAAIAQGMSDSLIERAADVMLKEQRQLLLVVREMPFSVIHLENMLRLARAGALIMPASPGFYHRPQRVEDLIDYVVARVLDHLQVTHALLPRWGEEENA